MNKPRNEDVMYAEFGFTSHMAQGLELESGNIVLHFKTLTINFNNINSNDEVILRKATEKVNKQTLGALLILVKKHIQFDDSAEIDVEIALDKRNYLSHHFFRFHNFSANTEEGCDKMIFELKEMQGIFLKALHHLSEISEKLDNKAGRSCATELGTRLSTKGQRVEI